MSSNKYPARYRELAEDYEKDAHWARSPEDRENTLKKLSILRELHTAEKKVERLKKENASLRGKGPKYAKPC